jgi:phage shock protein A
MEAIEQENTELREEVTTLQEDMERLNALVDSLMVAQNQPLTPRPLNTQAQKTVISEIPMCFLEI